MIEKHSTSKFATKLKFKIYKPNKNSQFFVCVSTNTDINKLNWKFNHIFLVITNRDFYCMLEKSHRISSGSGGRDSCKMSSKIWEMRGSHTLTPPPPPSPRFLSFQGVLLSFLFQHSFRTAWLNLISVMLINDPNEHDILTRDQKLKINKRY